METAITVNDKAAAFDRIAEAFLEIPAGSPTWEEAQAGVGRCMQVVQHEVVQLHPAYAGKRAEIDPDCVQSADRGTTR